MEEKPVSEISEKKKGRFKERCAEVAQFTRTLPTMCGAIIKSEGSATVKRSVLLYLSYGFAAFLLARCSLFFDSSPLMLAFVMQVGGRMAIPSFVGGIFGALTAEDTLAQCVALFLGMGARLILRYAPGSGGLFREPLMIRCALSFSSAFISSVCIMIAKDFSSESIYALAFSVLFAPIAAVIFSFADKEGTKPILRDVGNCFILFFVIYSLGRVGLFGVSLGFLVSLTVTYCTAARSGPLRAFVTVALCGLAMGFSYVPVVGAAGLIAGILMGMRSVSAVSIASIASGVLAIYISGYQSILTYFADALFASVIFIALDKGGIIPNFRFFESAEMKREHPGKAKVKSSISLISSSLESLSGELLKLSEERRRISVDEYKEICEGVLSERCTDCKNSSLCLGILYQETNEEVDRLSGALYESASAKPDILSEDFKERCPFAEEIVIEVNERSAKLCESLHRRDKSDIIALDYEAVSELLASALETEEREQKSDQTLAFAASRAMRSIGITAVGYSAYGERIKTVVARSISVGSLSKGNSLIKKTLENECKIPFCEPEFDFEGDKVSMKITSRERILTEGASLSFIKEGEKECGDSQVSFETEGGYSYYMICDGMGSGSDAARSSRISAVFLEKMISAGNKADTVLRMLSNFIRGRADECSSSADILEIDRYSAEATFTKCGAALSLLVRGDKAFRIESRSLPIGVTREIDPEKTKIALLEGDIIVMMSDGICDYVSFEDISLCVNEQKSESAERIANAIAGLSEGAPDDRSVSVIKILKSEK